MTCLGGAPGLLVKAASDPAPAGELGKSARWILASGDLDFGVEEG